MTDNICQRAFNYDLPDAYIAERPAYPYDTARLLQIDRKTESITDSTFSAIGAFLRPEDLLVFNNSKVIPARLLGHLGEAAKKVEILLINEVSPNIWMALGKPLKKFKTDEVISFSSSLKAKILKRVDQNKVLLEFLNLPDNSALHKELQTTGLMPIPPYIRKGLSDAQDVIDYQSQFARFDGSIAAPTASLHFTPELIERIKGQGVAIETLTLHVGVASFLPLWNEEDTTITPPAAENFQISDATWQAILAAKAAGRRVIAVGTTVVRALESRALGLNEGQTELFISPGFEFKICSAIITNFHQPRTTHLLLVEAFMGRELLEKTYNYALDNNLRFLSYGDGMLIE